MAAAAMEIRPRNRRRGFTLMELLIVIAIILVIAAFAVTRLNKVQIQARETAALASIRAVNQAQAQYYSTYGRYATSLAELGPPSGGGNDTEAGAGLLSTDLAAGKKQGYLFVITKTEEGYALNANPESFNGTGSRTFYSDQSTVIRFNPSKEPATAQSPELK